MTRAGPTEELRAKLFQHLESAQAIADQTGDEPVPT